MEWEVVLESATVTLIACTPAGVPGMVTGAFGEVELQPERESSPAANRNVSRLARIRRLLSPRMRRGEKARNTRPAAQAMPCREPEIPLWSEAVVVAVVVMVRVVVAGVLLAGIMEVGANAQEAPLGRPPQENLRVPL